MAVKKLKKSISLTDDDVQTFLEGEKNKIRIEKQKVTYSVVLVLAFLGNENRQLEDLSQADFGRVPEQNEVHQLTLRFLLGDCRSFYFHSLIKSC